MLQLVRIDPCEASLKSMKILLSRSNLQILIDWIDRLHEPDTIWYKPELQQITLINDIQ